jgi:hypothetical protein
VVVSAGFFLELGFLMDRDFIQIVFIIPWIQRVVESHTTHDKRCESVTMVFVFWGAVRPNTARQETVICRRVEDYIRNAENKKRYLH